MKFLSKTFSAKKSSQVKVTVSKTTSVKLMNVRNLEKYRKCQTNTYWGGDFSETTIVFSIPGDGQWAIVVEKGTFYNPIDIEATVELVSGGLETTPLPGGGTVLQQENVLVDSSTDASIDDKETVTEENNDSLEDEDENTKID